MSGLAQIARVTVPRVCPLSACDSPPEMGPATARCRVRPLLSLPARSRTANRRCGGVSGSSGCSRRGARETLGRVTARFTEIVACCRLGGGRGCGIGAVRSARTCFHAREGRGISAVPVGRCHIGEMPGGDVEIGRV